MRRVYGFIGVALLLGLAVAEAKTPKYSPPPPQLVVDPSTPPTTSSPPTSASGKTKVRCEDPSYRRCYYVEHTCPSTCPSTCEMDCATCRPVCSCDKPGAVCQDPKFIGADGITFYFHGKKEQDFCLVTDSNLHINGHFIGKRNGDMKRDFTWVQSLGILFGDHKLYVGALKTATWDSAVDRLSLIFDGEPIFLAQQRGASWKSSSSGLTITRTHDTNGVEITAEDNFKIKAAVVPITAEESRLHNYGISDDDCFAHLDIGFKFQSLTPAVAGVLGQTYSPAYVSRVKMGVTMPVLGGDADFSSSSLFATDCAVSKFAGVASEAGKLRFADLNCGASAAGFGVVCKR